VHGRFAEYVRQDRVDHAYSGGHLGTVRYRAKCLSTPTRSCRAFSPFGGIDEDEISLADTDMHEAFDIESAFGELERDGRLP
jgi:hypothetical protein